ncbi:restriction endonuclease subunit S (plasmid) [Komagataeibacter nataicola]|uniref:restriction endonuclease subunit S n=1 Tax=Komagataeibacter nataicola TaxID=265960 RepID=UPI0023DD5805|nr:restriction endonuclease subunit S [Komagataeibacter nataicola]WEQ54199.1 restriction endonuclease subunit S [Komagataeibacter nataicola]
MLPEGWRKASLEDVAEIRSGIARSQKRVENPITLPYLRVANVQDGYLDLTEIRTIEINKAKIDRFSLHIGDVLMNEGGDFDKLGRGDVWRGQITPCLHQNHVFAVRPDQKILDSYFLANLSASAYGKGYFLSCAKRSTNLASINSTQLKQFPVLLPPLPEQKKIAAILSAWDRAIEGTEKLLANSQQQKKSLMQQLLTGKKRLPGFTGKWKVRKFQDLFQERIETEREDLPLLSVTANDGIIFQEYSGRKDISKEDKSKYKRICVDDIGYNTMRMWQGRSCLSDKEGIVSPAYTIVFAKKNICTAFASYLFKFSPVIHVFYRHSQGLVSDTWNLKFKHFKEISWEIPSLPEQKTIAAVLTTADEEITALESDLSRLRREKKALMQQLLTGKRRVKVD